MIEPPGNNGPGPGLAHPPSPSSPAFRSSLTPVPSRPRLGPRRQSRFTEEVMTEGTPAASVSELSMDYHWYGPSVENVNTDTNDTAHVSMPNTEATLAGPEEGNRTSWLRFVNGSLHAVPCLVLLAILGCGMRVLRENLASHMSIQALILICLLFFDLVLDLITLFRAQRPWPTWGLGLRLGCGLAYILLFLLYVGLGGVFPDDYTYWGLPADSAAIPVYVLLCLGGLWNLLHIPVCRYAFGRRPQVRPKPTANAFPVPHNQTSFNHRFSVVGTEHSSISLTWRRWVRGGSAQCSRDELETGLQVVGTRESVDLTLREKPEEDGEAASSRVPSSHARKAEEGGLHTGGKWHEHESGQKEYPARPADIAQ